MPPYGPVNDDVIVPDQLSHSSVQLRVYVGWGVVGQPTENVACIITDALYKNKNELFKKHCCCCFYLFCTISLHNKLIHLV